MSSNFNKNLNTVLTDSHYPHLTNNLFKNLVLPYGLIVQKPETNNKNSVNIPSIVYNDPINTNLYDKLVSSISKK